MHVFLRHNDWVALKKSVWNNLKVQVVKNSLIKVITKGPEAVLFENPWGVSFNKGIVQGPPCIFAPPPKENWKYSNCISDNEKFIGVY